MSLDRERQAHEMARDNLSWRLDDGRGVGVYRHVAELPQAHVLVENECAAIAQPPLRQIRRLGTSAISQSTCKCQGR